MSSFQIFIIASAACFIFYCFIHALINHDKEYREIELTRKNFEAQEYKLKEDRKSFEKEKISRQAEIESQKEFYHKEIENIENIIKEKCAIYPQLAAAMADLLTLHYERAAKYLEKKSHPAHNEAHRIRELRHETKGILTQNKELEYKYNYIKLLYPNIEDVFDSGFNEEVFSLESEDETDRTRLFLSHDEFSKLSVTERNQLALDRYMERRKSKWQIGRDYEMYIGHKCEELEYKVEYNGILAKLEDMGRDLIATKGKTTYIIQCKNWSQEKTIYEKHIFQLYGTFVLYKIEHPGITCFPVFVTSTLVSLDAHIISDYLGVTIIEGVKLNEFPRIKCNINRQTGEKIYHLPFDQQYDKVIIEKNKGEFYAMTVAEAEEKGFRRAFRHFGAD